jgi:hypothetical protein
VDSDAPPEASDDIFALGALAFVALTEQAPRPGMDPSELQLQRPDVSARLAGTIARSLAMDPADRHLSMRELAAELSTVRESAPSQAMHAPVASDQSTQEWAMHDEDEATDDATALLPGVAGGDVELHPLRATGRPVRAARRRRDPRRTRSPRESRARILAWSMVLAPLAALVIFGLMIAGERGSDQVTSDGGASGGPTSAVPIASAVSFDPKPGGDGSEHADETANVFDGDRDTVWQTEGYATMTFSGGAKVRASDSPATTLAGWRVASEPTAVKDNIRVPVDLDGEPVRFVLLWITQLAIDPDDPNAARARISDVKVFASDNTGS